MIDSNLEHPSLWVQGPIVYVLSLTQPLLPSRCKVICWIFDEESPDAWCIWVISAMMACSMSLYSMQKMY